jgi:hypothetical protein
LSDPEWNDLDLGRLMPDIFNRMNAASVRIFFVPDMNHSLFVPDNDAMRIIFEAILHFVKLSRQVEMKWAVLVK